MQTLRIELLGYGTGRQKMSLNDGQIPHVRGVRVHVSASYNRVEASQRAFAKRRPRELFSHPKPRIQSDSQLREVGLYRIGK
jgi:hypothetical protein